MRYSENESTFKSNGYLASWSGRWYCCCLEACPFIPGRLSFQCRRGHCGTHGASYPRGGNAHFLLRAGLHGEPGCVSGGSAISYCGGKRGWDPVHADPPILRHPANDLLVSAAFIPVENSGVIGSRAACNPNREYDRLYDGEPGGIR